MEADSLLGINSTMSCGKRQDDVPSLESLPEEHPLLLLVTASTDELHHASTINRFEDQDVCVVEDRDRCGALARIPRN